MNLYEQIPNCEHEGCKEAGIYYFLSCEKNFCADHRPNYPIKEEDVDELVALEGGYCRKGHAGCFCNVGYPYERQCERCRDTRPKDDATDWCYQGGFCWTQAELEERRVEDDRKFKAAIEAHAKPSRLVLPRPMKIINPIS